MADTSTKKAITVSGHLEERRGIYRIILSWTDETGNRQRKSISTGLAVKGNKKKAETVLSEAKKEHEALLRKMPRLDNLRFADFMEKWLEAVRRDTKKPIRPTTFGGYQVNVQKIISPYFRKKGTLLIELTADDINDFYDDQLERGVKGMTVTKYHANISSALKYAVKEDYIPHSPMGKVNRPSTERFVGKFLKQSEAVKLFEAVKDHKLELGVIFGAFYGLRRSEVIGLRWESINFETNSITIEHTVTEALIDGKRITVADDKTKSKSSYRTLPLVPAVRAKLFAVREEQEANRKLCGKSYNKADSVYIYVDALGNRIKPNYLTSAFPEFLTANGFKRMRYHDLRHSCASLLLANGVSLKEIQEWLGHSDFAITANIYTHLEFDSKLKSAGKMSWIDDTSLASVVEATTPTAETEANQNDGSLKTALPDFMQNLLATGVAIDTIQAWLKQADFTSDMSLSESFLAFQGI
jgi:integrase